MTTTNKYYWATRKATPFMTAYTTIIVVPKDKEYVMELGDEVDSELSDWDILEEIKLPKNDKLIPMD